MASAQNQQMGTFSGDEPRQNGLDHLKSVECFLYDTDTKPSWIESIFGEPYHVKDKYASHRISFRFVITLASVYIVEGCSDWMMIALRYYGTVK